MLTKTFSVMIVVSFVSAVFTGRLDNMATQFALSLADSVNLLISLLGMMCFWSGFMNVLVKVGAVRKVSSFLMPMLQVVFGKNALDEDSLTNLSGCMGANFLGLGNAALPLGIKTVKSLEKKNTSHAATDSTIMFAVMNTVPFQLIPATLIAMRTKYGSANPFDVVPYIWVCSLIIICFTVIVCKIMAKLWRGRK